MQEDDIPILNLALADNWPKQPTLSTAPDLFESRNQAEMWVVIQRSATKLT